MSHWKVCAAGALAMLLAACSHPPLPPPGSGRPSPTAMVVAIRNAATAGKSVVQITPLRDPAVDGYLDRAHTDENTGRYQDALDQINAALKLSPRAPGILQFRAEIEILLRDYASADADARRSYALGPQVGGLCASNWQTVLEIAEARNDPAGVAKARTKRNACHKAGPKHL